MGGKGKPETNRLRNQRTKTRERLRKEYPVEFPEDGFRGRGEPEVVDGGALGEILRQWVKEWLAERDPLSYRTPGQHGGASLEDRPMGPLDWLAEKTEIPVRKIQDLVNGVGPYVGVHRADQLLTAIGETYILDSDRLPIFPNPRWSLEAWVSYMSQRGCV